MPLRNIRLTLSYDGTDFHGWQVQPDRPTIQAALRDAIERVTGDKVLPQGAGRTDAGVHALAQVASFQTSSSIALDNFRKALNSLMPDAIRISSIEDVLGGFHARHDAVAKTYQYRIYCGQVCPPFLVRYVHHCPYPIRVDAAKEAARLIIGEHDFTSFAAVDPEKHREASDMPSNVRTIFSSALEGYGDELVYTVRGNGFLHHMVRNLVGTFLLVGKATLPAHDIRRILAAKDRSTAGPTAPPQGLYLVSVEY